ncbi:MAG TPA: efflux RND transporter periplasmic adaptor subunit [Chitinophagales bacterium]
MKNKKLIIALSIVAVLLIILAFVGKKQGWFGKGNLPKVAVEKAQKRTIEEIVTASGKINPETEVKLSSEVSGEIILLAVKEGDSIQKGDLLVVINPVVYEAQESQANATVQQVKANLVSAEAGFKNQQIQYEQAKVTYKRQEQLHADKIISDQEFDQGKATLRAAQASFETAREQLNASKYTVHANEASHKLSNDNLAKTRIYAPISGIVSLVNSKLGERVVGTAQMTGTEILRIADLSNMQAEVDVNENDVLRVKVGDTAEIEVDAYRNKKFKGVVSQIAYSSATSTTTVATSQAINFIVKIKLQQDSYADLIDETSGKKYPFRPGMSATADIKTNSKRDVLSVPIQAVTTRDEQELDSNYVAKKNAAGDDETTEINKDAREIVFVVENGKAKAIQVSTGIQDASYIEILSGINEEQEVIKAPFKAISKTLKNGDLVEVTDEKNLFKELEK